ncbi:protein max-like isoform X1 [Pseudomyrmex gracilis]|uniref:protein max-like isoform X1 n=1 Tax=Pseudomyrmex gracilis TaxID=219809 RepID=UPI000994D553|nr:protein max-like isoform X1 [Pseudomyrmex gracilis]
MSDDDREIDIESDDGDDLDPKLKHSGNSPYYSQVRIPEAEKRAHHNALERKRRDHIKDSFSSLRDVVPALQGEKVASRAQILKKAAEYIQYLKRTNLSIQQDIEDLERQNSFCEEKIRMLEKTKASMTSGETREVVKSEVSIHVYDTESESSESYSEVRQKNRKSKKLKVTGE